MNRQRLQSIGLGAATVVAIFTFAVVAAGLANGEGVGASSQRYPLGDMGVPEDYVQYLRAFPESPGLIPPIFSWEDYNVVRPAGNQGSCGSCWAFAAVGTMESRIAIATGDLMDLSEQQLVSCDDTQGGCSGGSGTALRYYETEGPMSEKCAGYEAWDMPCEDLDHCRQMDYYTTGFYWVEGDVANDVKAAVYEDGPAYFRFNVYPDFFDYWDTAGPGQVYTNHGGTLQGGHAVLIVGWDDSRGAFKCRNSWGRYAGPNSDGTFYIAYSGHDHDLALTLAGTDLVLPCGQGALGNYCWHWDQLYHQIGRPDGDSWSASVSLDSPGYLSYGPYDDRFGQGKHQATFELWIDNNDFDNATVVTLDVVTNQGGTLLARRDVRRREFAYAGQWQLFTVAFLNPCFGDVEARIYWHDNAKIKSRSVCIKRKG
jgi:hypothetical protein